MGAGGWGRTHTYLEVVRGDFWCVYIFKVSKNKCILFKKKGGGVDWRDGSMDKALPSTSV